MTFAEAADRLNAAIDAATDVLCALDVNVRAAVPLSAGQLAFGKLAGGCWELIYVQADGRENPLKGAGIHVRIEAASKLDDLRAALIAEDTKTIGKIHSAIETVKRFVASRPRT